MLSVPCVLVSALGQRDGEGAALLGLGVCRGLMEELRLFRMALGAAELARVWAAVAPRKPERRAREGKRRQRDGEGGGGFLKIFSEIIAGCHEKTILRQPFRRNPIKLSSAARPSGAKGISEISTRSRVKKKHQKPRTLSVS